MNTKLFSQRFNSELSSLNFPDELGNKVKAVAKVFHVSRHLANAMLLGDSLPSREQLYKIAEELEVCPQWLSGATDKKKAFSSKDVDMNREWETSKESEESV